MPALEDAIQSRTRLTHLERAAHAVGPKVRDRLQHLESVVHADVALERHPAERVAFDDAELRPLSAPALHEWSQTQALPLARASPEYRACAARARCLSLSTITSWVCLKLSINVVCPVRSPSWVGCTGDSARERSSDRDDKRGRERPFASDQVRMQPTPRDWPVTPSTNERVSGPAVSVAMTTATITWGSVSRDRVLVAVSTSARARVGAREF